MSSKRRCCRNDADVLCYICGEYVKQEHYRNVRDLTKRAYEDYFGIKFGDQDKAWLLTRCAKITLIPFAFGLKQRSKQ